MDDPIAKLNHVGKETVKKLNELKASADDVQIDLGLPLELNRCAFAWHAFEGTCSLKGSTT